LNAPSETGQQEALESLEQARLQREELENSRWLRSSTLAHWARGHIHGVKVCA
jgi:hypothetical protein